MSITSLFNKYAGKEVSAPENREADPTLAQMKQAAADNGFELRVLYPGEGGVRNMRPNRITAKIERGMDDKYRVSGQFRIG